MKVQEKHGKVTQNMHGASRNYRYVWDISVPRSCRAAHEVSKVEHKQGRRTSHIYWSWTHGPRWTTHGTSGRRPWRWRGSRRWFLLPAVCRGNVSWQPRSRNGAGAGTE